MIALWGTIWQTLPLLQEPLGERQQDQNVEITDFVTGAIEIRNEIGRAVGMSLPGTLVFDYPTVSAIANYLFSQQARSTPVAQDPRRQPLR